MKKMAKYQGIKCEVCTREAPKCTCRPLNLTWAGYPMQLQRQWQSNYSSAFKPLKCFPANTRARAIALHRDGYQQASRRYCGVSRGNGPLVELSREDSACFRRVARTIAYYRMLSYVRRAKA